MITYVRSSLFLSPAQVLVNTVNTVGVMGKGIAKEFKSIYPEMYEVYRRQHEGGELAIGRLHLFRTDHKGVLNFPTKRHWRQTSHTDYIESGLTAFACCCMDLELTSVAFPLLGCGNGGLDWESQVRPIMERYLSGLPIRVYIHMPIEKLPVGWNLRRIRAWLRAGSLRLSPEQLWNDLAAVAALSENGTDAVDRPLLDPDARTMSLIRNDDTGVAVEVDWQQLFGVWERLNDFGLVSADDLERTLGPAAGPLVHHLGRLPYLEPTAFASRPEDLDNADSAGLQLLPPIRKDRRSSRQSRLEMEVTACDGSQTPTR